MGIQTITTNVGDLELYVPGEFNAYNAMAAVSAAMELGVPFEVCQQALKEFRGIWRRFERVGTWKDAEVISDYGHHPTSVQGTLEATREFFPGRRVVLCYQPHQHDRTKKLFDEFLEVLPLADVTVVAEIYDVAGRNQEHDVSSKDLVEAVNQSHVTYAPDLEHAKQQLEQLVHPNDVLLVMGAGDVDELARRLVKT